MIGYKIEWTGHFESDGETLDLTLSFTGDDPADVEKQVQEVISEKTDNGWDFVGEERIEKIPYTRDKWKNY